MTEATLRLPAWACGRPGMGQGGYAAARFADAVGQPLAVDFRAPVPLEVDLAIERDGSRWCLLHRDRLILDGRPRRHHLDSLPPSVGHPVGPTGFAETEPVSIAAATEARSRFAVADPADHPAAGCFSCGLGPGTMAIHPGLLADGSTRSASPWTPPPWTGDDTGNVAEAIAWTVMDCAQAFHVGWHPRRREGLTVRFCAEVAGPIVVGRTYAVVAFAGRWEDRWDGRKRGAGAIVFDGDGQPVAWSDSFWVAIESEPGDEG